MSFIQTDYREIIRQHYQHRSHRNPAYSLRAYARDLGIAFSRLHDTVKGKKGLSAASAKKIADKLNFSPDESNIFLTKVEAEHARCPERKQDAIKKLENLKTLHSAPMLEENLFSLIQDWHHFALVELTRVEGFNDSPEWIAKRLSISEAAAASSLEMLLSIGILKRQDGKLYPAEDFSFTESAIPSAAIRNNHEQVLHKAQQALHFQSLEERDFNALTLSVNQVDIPIAKKFIKDFLVEFDRKFGKGPCQNAVYSFSTQLVRIDKGEKK